MYCLIVSRKSVENKGQKVKHKIGADLGVSIADLTQGALSYPQRI